MERKEIVKSKWFRDVVWMAYALGWLGCVDGKADFDAALEKVREYFAKKTEEK